MSSSLKYKVIRDVYNQEEFDNQFYYNEKPTEPIWKLFFKYGNSFFKSNHQKSAYDHITDFVPILRWILEYRMKYLSVDIIAGITIGILNIPQAMAYSSLAGVPAVIGLYTSFLPSLMYSIFATSKHVSIGMFAVIALMIGNVEEKHGTALYLHMNSSTLTPDTNIGDLESVQLVACLTFTIGVVLAIMAICQFHIISVYLSDALIGGFTTGAAFHVLWSQIPKMFALQLPRRNGLFKLFYIAYDFFSNIKSTNFPDVILTFICLIFLYIGKVYINPLVAKKFPVPIPFDLIVVVFSIIMSHFFNFHSHYKMSIIAHIPTGFPTPAIPNFSWFSTLLPDAIIIAIVIYAVTISVAKLFAQKHNYVVSPSQEVRALAVCQMISSLLLCMPASGGLARSTLNSQIGSKSQVTSIVSSSLMLIVILWVGPLLYDLPTCVLSAIIAIALRPMFRQFLQLELYWKTSFYDFLIWIVSFLCTVTWDVSEGLICAIGFALLTVIIRIQCPKTKQLAKIGDTDVYRDYHQYEGYSNFPHIIIYRFDAPLLFLNCERFKTCGIELIQKANSKLQNSCKTLNNLCIEFLILDASAITNIDNMGAKALKNLAIELKQKYDVKLLITSHNKQFQKMCWVCGIYLNVPQNLFFPTIHDAVIYACEDLTNINEKENKECIHI